MSFSDKLFPNPMEQSYRNPRTNRYTNGPGDALDDDQQPGMQALIAANRSSPRQTVGIAIYLRNLDPDSTDAGIRNLCQKWGTPSGFKRFSTTAGMMWFKTLAEAETVMRNLNEGNPMEIIASFARAKENKQEAGSSADNATVAADGPVVKGKGDQAGIDWSRRTIKGPFVGPCVVRVEPREPYATESDYRKNANLRNADQDRDFCANDQREAFGHKRQHKFSDSPQYLQKMQTMALVSGGQHTKSPGFTDHDGQPAARGPCNVCRATTDKRCDRCGDFYCTVRCQRMDWPDHRRICFPMPRLVSTPKHLDEDVEPMPQHVHANGHGHPNANSNGVQTKPSPTVNRPSANNNAPTPSADLPKANGHSTHAPSIAQSVQLPTRSPSATNNGHTVAEKPIVASTQDSSARANRNALLRAQINAGPTAAAAATPPKPVTPVPQTPAAPEPPKSAPFYPLPSTNAAVILTYVCNHRKVYVRSIEADAQSDYIRTLQDCADHEKAAQVLRELPNKGDMVLARFEGLFYRAVVVGVKTPEDIGVGFIDFGNKESVTLADMRSLSMELQLRPRHAVAVMLDGMPDKMTNEVILRQLNDLVDTNQSLKIVFGGGAPLVANTVVTLFDLDTGKSINQAMIDLNDVRPVALTEPPIVLDDIEYVPLEGEQLDIVVLDNSLLSENSLWCVRQDHLNELLQNNDLFQKYCCSTEGPYTPRLHEVCLVLYDIDQKWYRAVCTELAGDGMPAVRFVDYGNNEVVAIKNIRKMPREFAYRRVTIDCTLYGIAEISTNMLDVLSRTFTQNSAVHVDKAETMKLAEYDSEFSQIQCNAVLDTLRRENLL